MPVRFDPDRKTLELAVADLLEAELLRSLGFANRGGYERLWLGQAIHSHYQEEALGLDASYRREVVLRHQFLHRGVAVTLHGRLDGLRRDDDGTLVVEEIKSVRRGAQLSPLAREVYERQAALYAWMLGSIEGAKAAPREPEASTPNPSTDAAAPASTDAPPPSKPPWVEVRAELVLIEIGSDDVVREEVRVDRQTLEAIVRRRLNGILHALDGERQASLARKAAATRLAFPYGLPRPGQERILAAVEQALADREHLLVEAPTGIGKTVAALYPALRYALAHDKRVFVLTARTLQQEMATAVLELLDREGAFHALRLRAKAKMCANDEVLCHEEYCPFAKDFYAKLRGSGILESLWKSYPILLPDVIYGGARDAQVCPFEVSLELGRRAQVVVCDYNYAFDPYVALPDFGADANLDDVILVIDEVHNLVARGRGYYSPELSSAMVLDIARRIGDGGEMIHRRLETLCLKLAELMRDTVEEVLGEPGSEARAIEAVFPEDALWRLRPELDAAFVDYLEHRRETRTLSAEDPFVGLYFSVLRFLNGLLVSDQAFSHYVELAPAGRGRAGGPPGVDHRFKILCKDPSRFLGGIINRTHTAIGLSATLSPPEFYRDLLGFDRERSGALSVAAPFPPENRQVVIDSTVATAYRERHAHYDRIASRLAAFVEAVPGNTLALFPSYQFLGEVADRLPPLGKRVLAESREGSDAARESVLSLLRNPLFGDVVLLAVAGGVFAEGVDYPGDMLKAVAVVGPCLPALTLEQRLLQAYYDERFARGFEYAFVVPGMTRVVQAAGRLIRSPGDYGVIALFDQRFLTPPYSNHLPTAWLGEDGPAGLVGDPDAVARRFFAAFTTATVRGA